MNLPAHGAGHAWFSRRPGMIDLLAFASVAAGLVLAFIGHTPFLILAGAGAFGPGIMRQFGVLKSRDEFQHQASIVAGYRAYLAGGSYAVLLLVLRPWTDLGSVTEAGKSAADTTLFVMLLVYAVSYLFHFWGARSAAYRILLVAGVGMAVNIVVLCLVHDFPWRDMVRGLSSWSAPLVVLAVLSRRFPRASGFTLIVLSVAGFVFVQSRQFGVPVMAWIYRVLFLVPLVASGIGLLGSSAEAVDAESR